jgi:hypothetical protein
VTEKLASAALLLLPPPPQAAKAIKQQTNTPYFRLLDIDHSIKNSSIPILSILIVMTTLTLTHLDSHKETVHS